MIQNNLAQGISDLKRRLRGEMTKRRAAIVAREAKALALRDHVMKSDLLSPDACLGAYWPISSEIDLHPLLKALHDRKQCIAMPAIERANAPLVFRAWHPTVVMRAGPFGTFEPDPEAPPRFPTVLLVPQLAFDRRGYRLGYGGGFYDRTIPTLRAKQPIFLTIGIAFAEQEVSEIPSESTDIRLDYIVTDTGIIRPDPGS
ncbi:MAG: 5-formyltetrahydrofolate cyclo-ligase [Alphaproteobacteria bacterium]